MIGRKTDRPSVLALSSELPWPLDSGGRIRTYHLLSGIAAVTRLTLIAPSSMTPSDAVRALEARGIDVVVVPVEPRTIRGEIIRAAAARMSSKPYVLFRRHDRPPVRAAIHATLAKLNPDVVYLDHLDPFSFYDLFQPRPVVLDLHNRYALLTERSAGDQSNPLKRAYLRGEASRLEAVEREAVSRARSVLSVSADEQAYFLSCGGRDVRLVPNGVDCGAYAALPMGRSSDPPTVLYVGGLGWRPNAEAAISLASTIMPKVRRHIPNARLVVVGRNPPAELVRLAAPGVVDIAGGVPDVVPYLASASLLAVPLTTGGGTRLKILEAFAAGLPVVSTDVGCEGIAAENGRELVMADVADFPSAIVSAIRDSRRSAEMAARARRLASEVYDWPGIAAVAATVVQAAAGLDSDDYLSGVPRVERVAGR